MASVLALAALALGAVYAFAVVGACAVVTWVCGAQTSADRRARRSRHARYVRAEQRESRLEQAGVPRTEIDELTALVDLACRSTTNEADHRELDDLLDAYTEASVAAHLAAARAELAGPCRRRRRDRWTLAGRRDELAQLIRLFAARATMPRSDDRLTDEAIARRLALLDADASAAPRPLARPHRCPSCRRRTCRSCARR